MNDLEALLYQLFLRIARVLLCKDAFLATLGGAIEGVGRFFGLINGKAVAAAPGVLDDSKVAAFQIGFISIVLLGQEHTQGLVRMADSHGLLMRLDTP